ncbi:MAG: sialate O-acetylesterase [Patescibacteria group bacterium]
MVKKLVLLVVLALIVTVSLPIHAANLAVCGIFTNNAVLQRGMPVPVFGTAADGTVVTVSFNGQNVQAVAAGGKWRTTLAAMPANTSPGNMVISDGTATITLTGLQVGEVWVLSGQSNMVKELSSCYEGPETAADAPNHNIRLFEQQSGTLAGVSWTAADAATAGEFSAVGYFFAHHLAHHMNPVVPIGLIQSAEPGTTIQEWCHYNGSGGALYDSYIKPYQPYAIRGVIWYQGESNTRDADVYKDYLVGLISEWRADWGQGDFPFQIVQLHGSLGWAPMREAQMQAWLSTANTAMAVAVDLPPDGSMHPLCKRPIGDRLGMAARRLWYGDMTVESSGPLRDPAHSYVQGNQMVIAFTHVGGGLVTGSEWQPGGAPVTFYLAGGDGRYYAGTAQIVGNTVVVTSPSVPNPVSVRYIWTYADGNLYNTDNLPAPPFEMTPAGSPPGGDTEPPTAPANLTATAVSSSRIDLSWSASTDNLGVTGYKVFRGGVEIDTVTGTTYQDTGLSPSTTYSYYVKAFDAAGNLSPQSNTAQATTYEGGGDTEPPTAPANLVATAVSSSRIDLIWNASTDNVGVTGYQIFRDGVQVGTSGTTSYSDTSLSPNTTYSYYVKAYDAAGNVSSQSNVAQATTQPGGGGSTVMHVQEIWTCDAAVNPRTTFTKPNDDPCWRVRIVDENGNPVSGASVKVDVYRPNGTKPWQSPTAATGADGVAGFSVNMVNNSPTGTYTLRINTVTKSGWTYNAAANVESETTFVLQ